jgi:ammonia channel protein AmtB
MVSVLSIVVVVLVWCSTGFGLFFSNGGQPRTVESMYGEQVQLFGDGVYANNSMLKATSAKGSDLVMLLFSVGLLLTTFTRGKGAKSCLLHGGFLVSILYYAATTAFGITYSRMFLVYLLLFSASFSRLVFLPESC